MIPPKKKADIVLEILLVLDKKGGDIDKISKEHEDEKELLIKKITLPLYVKVIRILSFWQGQKDLNLCYGLETIALPTELYP